MAKQKSDPALYTAPIGLSVSQCSRKCAEIFHNVNRGRYAIADRQAVSMLRHANDIRALVRMAKAADK